MNRFRFSSKWRYVTFLVCCCLGLLSAVTHGGEVTLFEDGTSSYEIVIDQKAVKSVVYAAERLQRDFAASTGHKLPLRCLEDFSKITPDSRVIIIGQNDYTRRLGIEPASISHDGYATRTDGTNLIIAGRDDAGEPHNDRMFTSAGSIPGVGRFLQNHLGVVQYLPGKLWHHVPRHTRVVVDLPDEVVQPSFLHRQISLNYIVRGDSNKKRVSQRRRDFLRWARINGAGSGVLGHTAHETDDMMRPFVKNGKYVGKPEWLALYKGKRMIPRTRSDLRVWYRFHLCTSHPEVRDIAVQYVRDFFAEKPDYLVAGISLSDGDRYCECDRCIAQDAAGVDSKTDRYVNFINEVAQRVKAEYPDKYLGAFIYAAYVEPPVRPENQEIADNLLLFMVNNGSYYFSEKEQQAKREIFEAWASLADHLTYYTWTASHGFLGLPLNNPDWLVGHIAQLKIEGYWGYRHLVMGSLHARQPDSFLWGQLVYEHDKDADVLLDEFYRDLYGNAAETVRSYHRLLAQQVHQANQQLKLEKDRSDDTVKKYEDRVLVYFEPVLAEARTLLDKAAAEIDGDELRNRRVRVLSDQLRIAELMVPAIQIGKLDDAGQASEQQLARLDHLRIEFHEHLMKHGNSDVLDIRDITEVPRYGRDDLMRYLLIPTDYEKWFSVPIKKRPADKWKDLAFRYVTPREALDAEALITLPLEWQFIADPKGTGEKRGLPNARPNGEWRPLRVDAYWLDQGIDHRHVGWYTTTLKVPSTAGKADHLWLLFNAVDGKAKVWIDGKLVGEQNGPVAQMWDKPWAIEVSGHMKPRGEHRVTVRLEKREPKGMIGIWKPIELRGDL
ncbi:MAG: DUF4838 domain-containing protein [Planctomycetota bacterium]